MIIGCNTNPLLDLEDHNKEDLIDAEFKILFVGNSLTYFNNLPELVELEAASKDIDLKANSITKGNYAIVDHWADGIVQQEIKSQQYDFVVIQQGPSSQEEGYQMLMDGGKDYANLCEANDTQLAYFMVWPSRQYYYTFDGVIRNYTESAKANNALLCPVGKIWKEHFDVTNDFSYYGPDGFHPSLEGSKVAAEVIVKSLFDL